MDFLVQASWFAFGLYSTFNAYSSCCSSSRNYLSILSLLMLFYEVFLRIISLVNVWQGTISFRHCFQLIFGSIKFNIKLTSYILQYQNIYIDLMIRLQELVKVLPKLTYNHTKGQNGLVGVIGGSFQYTGAPYYTAMAALKMGADLAHIFCSKDAAGPIKTYSPQLIVHPIFQYKLETQNQQSQQQLEKNSAKWVKYFEKNFNKINSWVIGPGLGRNKGLSLFFNKFIKALPQKSFLTIDADGLFFLCQFPQLMQKLKKLNCILTPNMRQFKHLNKVLNIPEQIVQKYLNKGQMKSDGNIAKNFQSKIQSPVTLVIKSQNDIIFHKGNKISIVQTPGGMKRCGGIGDVLAGCLSATSYWNFQLGPVLACHIVKLASAKGFKKHGRSLSGLGVLQQIQQVVLSLNDIN